MKRLLSHSEIRTLSTCEAAHAFKYTGVLSDGDTLSPKHALPDRLREGSAFGAAMAVLHAGPPTPDTLARARGEATMYLEEHQENWTQEELRDVAVKLDRIVRHYAATADLFHVADPETRLEVALPSRVTLAGGKTRKSTRYGFEGYLDGIHTAANGGVWIVDYKLRDSLSDFDAVANDRQWRRYAWAWREIHGVSPAGIKVVERKNGYPEPEAEVKRNANGRLSKIQACTPDTYRRAFWADKESGLAEKLLPTAEEATEILEKLRERHDPKHWQRVHTIILRESEIDEAGRELASAANRVGQLERGDLYPLRTVSRSTCGGCDFRDACAEPGDRPVVDAFYTREVPKRLRPPREIETTEREAA